MRSDERERTNVTALHPGRTGPPDAGRIGIVGDHRLVVESLQAALRAQGFVVDAVDARGAGPHEIVRAAVAGRPGVVLLDLDLRPSTDSTDLIAPLRAGGTRVLAITSSSVQPSTVRAQVRSILLELGVSSQLQAVALAHRRSWRLPRAG